MIDQCPHCQETLNLSAAQLEKVENALIKLPEGQLLKISCPHCKNIMELNSAGFPTSSVAPSQNKPIPIKQQKTAILPPKEPNLDWLENGKYEEKEVIQDVQMVLFLMANSPPLQAAVNAFTELDYKPVFAKSARDAIEKIQFNNYAAVVLHSKFESNNLNESVFHEYMRKLNMGKRRSIFYILIGPEFHSLYNLEALTNSANLVINDKEVDSLELILKKVIPEYEDIFSPYVDAMLEYGNKEGNMWEDVRRKKPIKKQSDILKDLLEIS